MFCKKSWLNYSKNLFLFITQNSSFPILSFQAYINLLLGFGSCFYGRCQQRFFEDGNKNRLREQDIHKIVDTFNNRIEIPGYSRIIPVAEITDPKNDYNLNIPRYIDSQETEDLQDIVKLI
ncbi:MAG: hypothetical protein A2161_04380 [Candidatus Schekmanbacteria bacterium RBG_13_48_7]|uniref:site-specific DNA-methyltransferase (adenine-specific) n=1 Tax=Candidatus Schekmanbacteria bacterium RBG_13_48_7 TaxID=1817878 RepID=A0A1F7S1L1_9BACT|nr:MAG: hypothetical protein A2161_04380 [Candidatus Schekmanbacteria bacterium RBG_13_48_7]